MAEPPTLTIRTYLDNGVVYEYDCGPHPHRAREHAAAIVAGGYIHNDGDGEFEHYPPHRILKVKICGGSVPTLYPDRATGV